MSPANYTEDALVQQTTANYLERQLGWESVYACNKEDFGPGSLLGRSSDREVVLTRMLREKLTELNPDLPDVACDEAVRQITAYTTSQSIVAVNREKYGLIRDGVQVAFQNEKGNREHRRLRVLDFDAPENNHFLCVRELWVKGDLYRRRADVVGFVNGLPLLFIECKNIHRNLKAAFEENYSDYLDTVPQTFHHNAVVMFGNGDQAKIGSLTSQWEHFHEWKRLKEDEPGVVDMETLLKGVCDKRNFIDLVENFILFDDSSGETRKILARNHQFLGVNRTVEAVRERKAREGRLGVFWHTQGAGKSYSMATFTRKVHRKLGGNFTFLVLTDREDLDSQIYKTFAGCGLVNHDSDPCRAESGEHLHRLLTEHKSYVFSLIQKFNRNLESGEDYTQRDDLIVMTDEAHRTQYGNLARNVRDALPNASFIGFTGTPLFKEDEITSRVFGNYVSTYGFQRAVEDGATVKLCYDTRGDRLGLAIGNLNERIAEKLEKVEVDDVDQEQRLQQELQRDYHVVTAKKRLDQVARDLVRHYSTAWETGKAMLVCIDKVTCVRMYELIERYWRKRIGELEAAKKRYADEQEAARTQNQIDWMNETRMAVVISEEQGEVEKFRKWDLDVLPHRRLIKEGMELPPAMREQPQFRDMQRMALDEAFKSEEHPFRVAIVCAMWLTGFDVPSLGNLYLDKPLKEHTLMQAIARANRVNEGKNNGLIVDYCGILKHLRRALATFAGTRPDGKSDDLDPAKPNEELLNDLAEAIGLVRGFLDERNAPLEDVIQKTGFDRNAAILACKEAANENDETRKRFEITCREVFRKFKACLNVEGVKKHRAERDAVDIVYKGLQRDRERADVSGIIRQLQEVVDEAVETQPDSALIGETGVYDISKIDFKKLQREFERSQRKNTTVQNLKTAVENRLHLLLEQNPLRTNLQTRYEAIIAEYNNEKDRVTIERTFEALLKLVEDMNEEESRAAREGLNEGPLAIFDLLKKPDLSAAEIKHVKAMATGLLQKLKADRLCVVDWTEKERTRDGVKGAIRDYLWSDATGLPAPRYTEDEVETRTEEIYRHVHRAYPRLPSPVYGAEAA